MDFVPQIVGVLLAGLVLTGGAAPALAGGLMPGNGGLPLLPLAAPAASTPVTLTDHFPSVDVFEQKFGVHDGRLDFFSLSPSSQDSGSFKPELRSGVGHGGVQFQLNW